MDHSLFPHSQGDLYDLVWMRLRVQVANGTFLVDSCVISIDNRLPTELSMSRAQSPQLCACVATEVSPTILGIYQLAFLERVGPTNGVEGFSGEYPGCNQSKTVFSQWPIRNSAGLQFVVGHGVVCCANR